MRYFATVLLLALASLANAQDSTIIALEATSADTFTDDYKIDSLLRHLNVLTLNKHIRFVRSTEDDTRSGFRADSYVTIRIKWKIPPNPFTTPLPPPDMNQRPARVLRGVDGRVVEDSNPRPQPASTQYPQNTKASAECYLAIRGKGINSKPLRSVYTVEAPDERELLAQTMISLLNRLLGEFDKPKGP
ncbi:hypothetical protein [Flaviaesturariibacter terrae]